MGDGDLFPLTWIKQLGCRKEDGGSTAEGREALGTVTREASPQAASRAVDHDKRTEQGRRFRKDYSIAHMKFS